MPKIIIAGGNGLIGSALVKGFREKGAEVVCADISGDAEYFEMGNPDSLKPIFKKHNDINAFVNCTYPHDLYSATRGWLDCTELAAIELCKTSGSIVNFGSIYGMVGPQLDIYEDNDVIKPPTTEYAFIKGGIIAASKNIATKYAKYGVRCNVISPGGVYDNQPKEFVERYNKRCPMGRMAVPEDLIEWVWLLCNQGSEYISGQNIAIDGGWTAQ